MPRQRNPVAIAAGKLILAIQKEWDEVIGEPDSAPVQQVMHRARTLLQASQSSSVANLLDGRSVGEYLDAAWIETHPAVKPAVAAFVAALATNEEIRPGR